LVISISNRLTGFITLLTFRI